MWYVKMKFCSKPRRGSTQSRRGSTQSIKAKKEKMEVDQ